MSALLKLARSRGLSNACVGRGLRRKRGAALVEFALVVLLLVILLLGIIDVGYVFFVQHNMVNAARDAARTVAVKDGTAAAATAVANDRLSGIPLNFSIAVSVPDGSDPDDRDVGVVITTPLSAASFGLLSGNLRADVTMRMEGVEE